MSGALVGGLHIADRLRPEAVAALAELRRMGLRTVLLTGDSKAIAEAVGRQLAIDDVHAGMLPSARTRTVPVPCGPRVKRHEELTPLRH